MEKSVIPEFYKQILLNFLEIRTLYQSDNGHHLILFNNKDILIDGKNFFPHKWKEKGAVFIQDILDNNGKPLSFKAFQDKFAIKHLLQKASSISTGDRFIAGISTFLLTPSLNIDLSKMKCKDYYWLYINGSTVEATGPKKWERELKLQNIDWKSKFTLIGKICHENKLREFNLKLIHPLNVTKKELCTHGLENENKCLYCDEPDSITYTFVECRFSQVFFTKVINWFNVKFNCALCPTAHEKLFGIVTETPENNVLKLNYCLLFVNIIYTTRKCTPCLVILMNSS